MAKKNKHLNARPRPAPKSKQKSVSDLKKEQQMRQRQQATRQEQQRQQAPRQERQRQQAPRQNENYIQQGQNNAEEFSSHAPLFNQMSAMEPRKITNPYKSVNPNEIFFDEPPEPAPQDTPTNRKSKKNNRRAKKENSEDAPVRKITRAQARKRRNRTRLLAVLITLLVLLVGFVLSVTVLFKISGYELDGDSPYSVQDLEMAFAYPVGENIFSFKIADVQIAMEKVLPYAETVIVRRRLPGTIVFKVKAAIEAYYIEMDGTFVILSQNLKILRTDTKSPNDLVKIEGGIPQSIQVGDELSLETIDKLNALNKLLTALETGEFGPITTVDITNELEMSVLYDNRARIIVGTQSDLHDKFAIAKTVMEEHIGKDEHGVLDVSHQNENEHRSGVWRAGKI